MTVCIFLNPSSLNEHGRVVTTPWLVADTMATIGGRSGPRVLPTTPISALPAQGSPMPVYLVRKLYLIGDQAALAFAGEEPVIRDVFEEIRAQLPIWLRSERPMERLQSVVNEYSGIEIVGATIEPSTKVLNHISPKDLRIHLGPLGYGSVVGSGRNEILRCIASFNSDVHGRPKPPAPSLAREFILWLQGISLANELMGVVTSWGGYLEYAYIEESGARWVRPGPVLHLFFEGELLRDGLATLHLVGRAIAYDPGAPHGRLLSVSADAPYMEFVLEDLLHPWTLSEIPGPREFWSNWRPHLLSVTVILPEDPSARAFSFVRRAGEEVTFEFSENGTHVGLTWEDIDKIGRLVTPAWGRRYVRAN